MKSITDPQPEESEIKKKKKWKLELMQTKDFAHIEVN